MPLLAPPTHALAGELWKNAVSRALYTLFFLLIVCWHFPLRCSD